MNKIEYFLDEYGLELRVNIESTRENIRREDYLANHSEVNLLKRFIGWLEWGGIIAVKDADLFLKKMGVSSAYRKINPLIKEFLCIELKDNYHNDELVSYLISFYGSDRTIPFVESVLESDPEKFGFNPKEYALKKMFCGTFSVEKEIELMVGMYESLTTEKNAAVSLANFVGEITKLLIKEKDETQLFESVAKVIG